MYQQTQNPDVLDQLVYQLVADHQFDRALAVLKKSTGSGLTVDPNRYLYIYLNSSDVRTNNIGALRSTIDNLYQTQREKFSADDDAFYGATLALLGGDTSGFYQQLGSVTDTKYTPLKQAVGDTQRLYSSQRDVPAYYLTALTALDMLRYGYYKIAQQVALTVSVAHPDYVLPQQILAYSHFMLNDREVAAQYLSDLKKNDTANLETYQFMLGISQYRQGQYSDAIFSFKELWGTQFEGDSLRYMLLCYQKLNDTQMMQTVMQRILDSGDMRREDFMLVFDNVLYGPWVASGSRDVVTLSPQTTQAWIQACYAKLPTSQQGLCQYGQAGRYLSQGQGEKAIQFLLVAAQQYPRSYVFEALGDWYFKAKQYTRARDYYIQSMAIETDPTLKQKSKDRLLKITTLETGTGALISGQ